MLASISGLHRIGYVTRFVVGWSWVLSKNFFHFCLGRWNSSEQLLFGGHVVRAFQTSELLLFSLWRRWRNHSMCWRVFRQTNLRFWWYQYLPSSQQMWILASFLISNLPPSSPHGPLQLGVQATGDFGRYLLICWQRSSSPWIFAVKQPQHDLGFAMLMVTGRLYHGGKQHVKFCAFNCFKKYNMERPKLGLWEAIFSPEIAWPWWLLRCLNLPGQRFLPKALYLSLDLGNQPLPVGSDVVLHQVWLHHKLQCNLEYAHPGTEGCMHIVSRPHLACFWVLGGEILLRCMRAKYTHRRPWLMPVLCWVPRDLSLSGWSIDNAERYPLSTAGLGVDSRCQMLPTFSVWNVVNEHHTCSWFMTTQARFHRCKKVVTCLLLIHSNSALTVSHAWWQIRTTYEPSYVRRPSLRVDVDPSQTLLPKHQCKILGNYLYR